jgi:hypothetical protein
LKLPQKSKAIHVRHLHIEEHQIRRFVFDYREGFRPIGAFPNQFDRGITLEHFADKSAGVRLIIDDQDAEG